MDYLDNRFWKPLKMDLEKSSSLGSGLVLDTDMATDTAELTRGGRESKG